MTRRNDRMTPEEASSLTRQDRWKIIVMFVGVALLGGSYFYAQTQSDGYSEDALAEVPRHDEIPTERVVIPEFDMLEVFDDLQDGTPESRLVLEAEALNAVFDYGRLFTPQHYKALDPKPLDTETLAALKADPGQFRVSAFRARGEVISPKKRRRKLDINTVRDALEETGGNKLEAAKVLGVSRATLYRFLEDVSPTR